MRLELLLERLAKHENIRLLVEQTTGLPSDELVESLVKEFEQVVERYKNLSDFARQARQLAANQTSGHPSLREAARSPSVLSHESSRTSKKKVQGVALPQPLRIEPIKIDLPSIDLKLTERSIAAKRAEEERKAQLRRELETIERMIHAEIERDWQNKAGEIHERIVRLKNSQQLLRKQLATIDSELEESEETHSSVTTQAPQPRLEISDDDIMYLHAVGFSQNTEDGSSINHVGDLKGIDGKNPVFIVEHAGCRFFVSKMQQDYLPVTKSGLLLLGNQEALHLRSVHEEILNRLKCEERHLPFEFGSLIRGKDEFFSKVESASQKLRVAIEAEGRANVWSLKLFALDSRAGKIASSQLPVTKARERGRETKRTSKRFDIKLLERILRQEQKIAETIHKTLTGCSVSSEVVSMISISNGTSEDWKLILHSSYEIATNDCSKFFSTIFDLQEEYRTMGIMFEVHGASERFSFALDSPASQAISA